MKTITKMVFLILLGVIGINAGTYAGGIDETDVRKASGFDAVKVSTGIDLYISMGENEKVKIVADDDIIDRIVTEVKDGTLHIYTKKGNWFDWGVNKTRKAYVTVKELKAINATSGADVKSENTLKGEDLTIKASSGSDIEVDVFCKNLWLDASSGSDAKISGKVKNLEAESSSGSDIKAQDLESSICKVRASSGSDATVNVTDELYAKASSGGDIVYYGNPSVTDTDESSGGDVRKR